ncbi:hypothetical protein PtA15_7A577 [Puccinia triticina]|uniref:Hydrophobin n=1 Tax=Puccinia triticina TaxID=208348 RepID=A0ABY7CRA0_9BASI|nr:uncharacterized protein PtA15_7A577 [Puccinia triticina]WAQ86848.1 hypothetical protein PtA15_7A577 [Puccinia triticina]
MMLLFYTVIFFLAATWVDAIGTPKKPPASAIRIPKGDSCDLPTLSATGVPLKGQAFGLFPNQRSRSPGTATSRTNPQTKKLTCPGRSSAQCCDPTKLKVDITKPLDQQTAVDRLLQVTPLSVIAACPNVVWSVYFFQMLNIRELESRSELKISNPNLSCPQIRIAPFE